jgi:ATP-binding cassette subfamily B protein/subfamily B ATP-binding cassette protein MsbA
MKNLRRALAYFRPDLPRVVLAFGLITLSAGAGLLKPWPLALLIDSVLGGKPLPAALSPLQQWPKGQLLALFGVAIILIHTMQGVFLAWGTLLSIRAGLKGLTRVRTQLFAWLERLSVRFHQGSSQGDILYRASWDTYAFQTLFQQGLFTFLQSTLVLTLMLIIMLRLDLLLALVAAGTVPLLLGVMISFGRAMNRRSLAAHQADSSVTSFIQQSIAALPLIQSYTREEHELQRFTTGVKASEEKRVAQHGAEVGYSFTLAVVFGIGTAAIGAIGASRVLAGQLTLGELVVFLAYLTQLYEPLNQLSRVNATLSDASAGTQRVFEILDAPEEVKESQTARHIALPHGNAADTDPGALVLRGALEFDRVEFAYEAHQPVLRRISFSVSAGESVAIVGPSGSGKTTLLQLLPRFFDPASGAVRLDGVDLRDLKLRSLRSSIAFVPQEPLLLPGTIAENIAFARPEAAAEQIEQAARAASAHEFIRQLPRGYDTLVGDAAARLSVGEKQRINLARAFLKDAPILALDEPTSALDQESEEAVIHSLETLLRGRTTLIVAHRLSTLRSVDKVVVIEGGALTECGRPDELLGRGGYFARVARKPV